MNMYGIQVIESVLAARLEVRRVPGGYMNRWLVRAEVLVPGMIHDRINNRIYIHPSLMPAMRKSTVASQQDPYPFWNPK